MKKLLIQYIFIKYKKKNEVYSMNNILEIKEVLKSRGVKGDSLLNALDTAEDIFNIGGNVKNDGHVVLYHATTIENAKKILDEGSMYGKEDGIFFSTKKDGEILGYGNEVIEVYIPIEKLILDDEFSDELHYKIKVKPYSKTNINMKG